MNGELCVQFLILGEPSTKVFYKSYQRRVLFSECSFRKKKKKTFFFKKKRSKEAFTNLQQEKEGLTKDIAYLCEASYFMVL